MRRHSDSAIASSHEVIVGNRRRPGIPSGVDDPKENPVDAFDVLELGGENID